ncbi:hypothetical protein F5888DRAFT_1805118 [Russula emetica]|nr:hypothetical protein F5888DRAFT_1805118 [Russula emetica]
MNMFNLFWMTNDENSSMKVAYKRCTYFLGLLKGPKVEDWVNDQTTILREKIYRISDPIAKTSETLWDNLKDDFERSYANTGQVEQAKRDLRQLNMVGDKVDDYIAKFENLLRKAEIPRDEVGALEKFKDGLAEVVHRAIMRRENWPTDINGWQEATQREIRRFQQEIIGDNEHPTIAANDANLRLMMSLAWHPAMPARWLTRGDGDSGDGDRGDGKVGVEEFEVEEEKVEVEGKEVEGKEVEGKVECEEVEVKGEVKGEEVEGEGEEVEVEEVEVEVEVEGDGVEVEGVEGKGVEVEVVSEAQLERKKSKKKDDAVPMEIDAAWTQKEKLKKGMDRSQLSKEGRCFKCLQQGHLKKDCPEWKGKPPPYKPKVTKLATVTEETKEEPFDLKELARTMATLDNQKKEDLFDILINEQGF